MRKLIEIAVRRRVATLAIVSALTVLGVVSYLRLPTDFLPNIAYPLIKVHVWWRGATAEEVELNIGEVIEKEMSTVEGLDYLESSSIEGGYTLQVNFRYGVDTNVAFQDTQSAMARAARKLPPDMDPPIVIKADPQQLPVVELVIRSTHWNMVELRDWVENWLYDRIQSISGVSGGEITGGLKREIRIHPNPQALERYELSLDDITKAIRDANVEKLGGRVITKDQELIIRTMGELRSPKEMESIVVRSKGLSKVRVGDLGKVIDSHEEVRLITRLGSSPCVKLSIHKQPDRNTLEVEKALRRRLSELRKSMPGHIQIAFVESQAQYISTSLKSVKEAVIQAAVLLLVVTILFLGSLRQALVLMITIPFVLLTSFTLLHFLGFSINVFTLAGLVVALGIMLDNAIVVVENMTRLAGKKKATMQSVAVAATHQVGGAVLASTLTLLALFLPYTLVSGITSLLFRELILTVSVVAAMSTLCSLTVVPMLGSWILSRKKHTGRPRTGQRILQKIQEAYSVLVGMSLKLRWFLVAVFLAVMVWASILVSSLGSEFLPEMDDGRVMVKVKLPTGAALNNTDEVLASVYRKVSGDPLIQSAFTLAGGKVWGLYTFEVANEGELDIQLVDRRKRRITTMEYMNRLSKKLKHLAPPGGKVMVRKMRIKGIRKMGESDLEIQVRGTELNKLYDLARQVVRIGQELPHLTNVHLGMDMTKPELHVHLDRLKMADLGLTVSDVADTLRTLAQGMVISHFREGKELYPIRIRIPETKISSRQDIENMIVVGKKGDRFRIRDIATVKPRSGPVEIVRENMSKLVVVRADIKSESLGEAMSALRKKLDALDLPPGYEISFAGKARYMKDLGQSTLFILVLAVFLGLTVLAVQFNSARYPLLILASILPAVCGMVFALKLTDLAMGATVLVGFLLVVGATINDGVLLFTLADELRGKNRSIDPRKAVAKAAAMRLRPRVMTTVTTIAGLLPLALNWAGGGELLQPMAAGAIGGLLLEIPVALFLMPCLYILVSPTTMPSPAS